MIKYSFLGIIISLFFACGNPTKKKQDVLLKDYFLFEEDIFNYDKIRLYLSNKIHFKKEADDYFFKGMNFYKNLNQLDSSKSYIISSILKEPNAKAYYELGNVLMDKKSYQEAKKAYQIAEILGYEPYSKILYNFSCIYSLQDSLELSANYLEYAMQAGYSNLNQIRKDADLNNLRKSYWFEGTLKKGMQGMSNPDQLYWVQFKRLFPKLNQNFKIDPFDRKIDLASMESISYDFEKYIAEMRDDKFSRDVGKTFYFYSLFKESADYVALIYILENNYLGNEAPLTYKIATFNNNGELIDKREIAGGLNLSEPMKYFKMLPSGELQIDEFVMQYEKDVEEFGYLDNKLTGKKKENTTILQISKEGKFISAVRN